MSLGRKRPADTIEKLRAANIGKVIPLETRKKISIGVKAYYNQEKISGEYDE